MATLVIQIPAYNEAETLPEVLGALPREIAGVDEIKVVVVDDGSTDGTATVALKHGADYVLRHLANCGLSESFIDGIEFSLALGADVIVNTDGDHQYPGESIPALVKPILERRADLVIGDRQLSKNAHFSPFKRWLEAVGTAFVRSVSATTVKDAASGFRAYSRHAALPLKVYNPYSYTLETLIHAGNSQLKIVDVPIETNPAKRASRLHKGIFHFLYHQAGAIIRSYVLYRPLRTFLSTGLLAILAGLIPIIRFLYFYFSRASSGHVQSLSLGTTLVVVGMVLVVIGFLSDAIRANQKLTENTLILLRNAHKFENSGAVHEFLGQPVYTKEYPPTSSP
ncbi:MAG: glycosyltransferase family 2 protein [Chloroflexi bacterium]|nr:glycosyltransferase family 2 protein [Chloroflexota bacterium]